MDSQAVYPLRRVMCSYLLGTGALCGSVYALLLHIWQAERREPVLMLMSLLNLDAMLQIVSLALNGVWFAVLAGLLTAVMVFLFRPRKRYFWLLCSALLAALGAVGPYLLLNLAHPLLWKLPGWPAVEFGVAAPLYLLALAGAISGWLMGYWCLPYEDD